MYQHNQINVFTFPGFILPYLLDVAVERALHALNLKPKEII